MLIILSNIFFYIVQVPDGKPVIGPVPGLSNVYVAAGHEGEGLTLVILLSSSNHCCTSFLPVIDVL